MLVVHYFIIFVSINAFVCSASDSSSSEESKEELSFCEYEGLQIKKGKTVAAPIGECQKITCHAPGAISAIACPAIKLKPDSNCRISETDLTKPFPKCCARVICDGGDEPVYCDYKGLKIKKGETVPAPIGKCHKITCHEPGRISSLTCAAYKLKPGSNCRISDTDLTKPYPKCCPRTICDEEPPECEYNGIKIKQGETAPAPLGECLEVSCEGPHSISALTCPEFIPHPNCTKSELDLTKQYPDCCPDTICQ